MPANIETNKADWGKVKKKVDYHLTQYRARIKAKVRSTSITSFHPTAITC
jgi:hypothetical protein